MMRTFGRISSMREYLRSRWPIEGRDMGSGWIPGSSSSIICVASVPCESVRARCAFGSKRDMRLGEGGRNAKGLSSSGGGPSSILLIDPLE